MEKSYIMLSMDDENAKNLAEVIGNKTSKKILSALAEKEKSESDLSKELSMPINTIEYNLKKLISAGLIEKAKSFFWSVKGKKILYYKLSNKYIIIAPKKSNISGIKTFLPVAAILGLGALAVNYFSNLGHQTREQVPILANKAADAGLMASSSSSVKPVTEEMVAAANTGFFNWFITTPWAVFLAGGIIVIAGYLIVKKILERRSNK